MCLTPPFELDWLMGTVNMEVTRTVMRTLMTTVMRTVMRTVMKTLMRTVMRMVMRTVMRMMMRMVMRTGTMISLVPGADLLGHVSAALVGEELGHKLGDVFTLALGLQAALLGRLLAGDCADLRGGYVSYCVSFAGYVSFDISQGYCLTAHQNYLLYIKSIY